MADFKPAIAKVLLIEGGYANDPNDSGGETYKGISRKFWPEWLGWSSIDTAKLLLNFPNNIKSNAWINVLVIDFYKANFWNKIGGDAISNQSIANQLMDAAVNEGIVPAIKRAQEIVGLPQTGHVTDELIEKLNLLA